MLTHDLHIETPLLTRRKWGTCPATEACNAKFKNATLLALFLGTFGVDQFYAHHCKFNINPTSFIPSPSPVTTANHQTHMKRFLWCGGDWEEWADLFEYIGVLAAFKLLTLGGLGTWSLIDVVLWIVGGIYGLPDCGGGYGGWDHDKVKQRHGPGGGYKNLCWSMYDMLGHNAPRNGFTAWISDLVC